MVKWLQAVGIGVVATVGAFGLVGGVCWLFVNETRYAFFGVGVLAIVGLFTWEAHEGLKGGQK